MSWESEVKDTQMRRTKALELGGKERVKKQHAEGKLTIRERKNKLHSLPSLSDMDSISTI